MIVRLTHPLHGIALYACPLEGAGRAAERAAVEKLGRKILHSAIAHRPDGSPYAADSPDLPVSISHGAATALLAVGEPGGRKIGVDIESTDRSAQLERVRRRFVAEADDTGPLSLLHLWTAKEAAYKAAGQPGLSLTDITVDRSGRVLAGTTGMTVVWIPYLSGCALIALAAVRP